MHLIGYLLLIIIFLIVCALAVLNAQQVTFNYLLGSLNLPLILLLLIVFVSGLIIGMLLILLSRIKCKVNKAQSV
ncbi:lipopolysaccharide assembly protein LapA domain-containing protein [Fastidiosibacter lacustris]|uniref:lipopolysaccharide assembly protein LapA domain-containing protein n=1 Tax=Fastidiosibacter lacustris TaxID=2056695 RepID=UPI000E349F86